MRDSRQAHERTETVRSVLLDIDGTLVDSNDAHAAAWVMAFFRHGHAVAESEVRDAIGKGGDKLLSEVAGIDEESAEGRAISRSRESIFEKDHLPRLRAVPGARELVERIVAAGMQVGVASSAKSVEVDALLKVAGVEDLITHRTSSDDAERSKPDPGIVHAALQELGADPATTVLIGDTPHDVEAGLRAGVRVIAVRSGGWSVRDLEGAIEVYRDAKDIVTRFEDSTLGAQGRTS